MSSDMKFINVCCFGSEITGLNVCRQLFDKIKLNSNHVLNTRHKPITLGDAHTH